MNIEQKDFSEILSILQTNGVGFIKCLFRSNLNPEDIEYEPTKPWRLDFSDGIKYLGSLVTDTDIVGFSTADGIQPLVYDCYIDKKEIKFTEDLKIILTYTAWPVQGECILTLEESGFQKHKRKTRKRSKSI